MKFTQIPNIEEALCQVIVKTLSPSTFSWIRSGCAYQVLLQKALAVIGNKVCELPSHRNTALGTIVHRIYELSANGTISTFVEMKDMWEKLVSEYEKTLDENYPTLHNPNINDYDKRNKAIKFALSLKGKSNIFCLNNEFSSRYSYVEKKLACKDIGLCGIADKVIVENKQIYVIDYKSGSVHDLDGNIKSEYIVQLHLYAKMCEHIGLGDIKSLILIDIEGQKYNIPYDQNLCLSLIEDVSVKIHALNEAISSKHFDNLVKSDEDRCCICSCRHICRYMIQSNNTIYKTLSGIIERLPSSNMYVVNHNDVSFYVSGLDVYSIDNPQSYVGKKLVFLNIVKSSQIAEENTFKVTENTIVYELL